MRFFFQAVLGGEARVRQVPATVQVSGFSRGLGGESESWESCSLCGVPWGWGSGFYADWWGPTRKWDERAAGIIYGECHPRQVTQPHRVSAAPSLYCLASQVPDSTSCLLPSFFPGILISVFPACKRDPSSWQMTFWVFLQLFWALWCPLNTVKPRLDSQQRELRPCPCTVDWLRGSAFRRSIWTVPERLRCTALYLLFLQRDLGRREGNRSDSLGLCVGLSGAFRSSLYWEGNYLGR